MTALSSVPIPFFIFAAASAIAFGLEAFWLRRARSGRQPWQVWTIAALLLVLTWDLAGKAGNRERERIRRITLDFAQIYGSEMEKLGHWRLENDAPPDDPLYLGLIAAEKRWLGLGPTVNDIYTFRERPDGKHILVVDSETDYDHNGKYEGEREQRTPIGEVYEEDEANLRRAFRGKSVFAPEPVTDRWGTWLSSYVPLRAPDGRVEAVLGVDFEANTLTQAISAAEWRVIGFMAVAQLLLLGASTLISLTRAEADVRQRAEEELRSAHAQLEQMVTYSPALIYRLKVDGDSFVPVAVSANITALLGYAVAEVLNREWWPAQLHPEDRERVLAGSSEMTGQSSSRAEYRVRHKAGGYRWIEDHRRVLCDAAGRPLEIIGVWMDITERKQAEESLRLLSSAVEQSRESILITDAELDPPGPRIVFANPAYLQMTGYTIEEIVGKTPRMMQGPRSNRAALRRLRHNLEHGEAFSGETVNYRKDGSEYDQEWQVAPIRNAEGKITHFVSIQHDITERKRAEQALRASQEHMRLQTAALESAANGVVITNATGTIQWVNRAFTCLTGYTPEEAIGQNPRVLKSGRHPEAYYNGMWQTLSAGRVWRGEIVNRRKDGELYHEAMTITPIRDAGGVTTHYIAIKQDISERKRSEASIQEMHKQLLDASRQAGMAEIATNVLHNVGNVLNSVNISVSVATEKARGLKVATLERLAAMLGGQPDLGAFFASDPRGAEVPDFLTRIAGRLETDRAAVLGELEALRRHIDHINEIVAMQQNYARACGVTEVLPLVDLIEDALRLNAGSIERHGLVVVRDFAEVPPIPVDRHKVLQILVNLIRNAKHALDDGAPAEKRLTLRLARLEDASVRITVSDNGVGIPRENMTRIFEHGFTTRKDGHGFGLHSSANAAGEMGGSLTAQSDGPGRGATFTLELPLPSKPHSP